MLDGAVRCPACNALDWERDGYSLRELRGSTIVRRRVASARGDVVAWACARCRYAVPVWAILHARLNALQLTADDPPASGA